MADTFVLRFRDLTNDNPIEAHRGIISDSGYVWWGWWKKDSEPSRYKELEELREKSRVSPLLVGLFDRSQKKYYAASVTDCIHETASILSPEVARTPVYYRTEKVAAWLKICSINEINESEFRNEFTVVPTGDGTFFPLWRGSVVSSVLVNLTAPNINIASPTLLHISDIHLGADYGFPQSTKPGNIPLVDLIARDFADERPGIVVISGDFTTRADANVLQDDGLRFVRELAGRLELSPDKFVFVPGNHDIALKKWRPQDYSHENTFHLFSREFFGEKRSFPDLRRFTLPNGRALELLTINSVRLRHESEKQFGYVQWPLYDLFLNRYPHDPEILRVAVLHHHLVSAPREETLNTDYLEAAVSTTLDAGAVIEGLHNHGFSLVLHGHQHVPAITRVARATRSNSADTLCDLQNTIVVLSAGSAGACVARLSNEMRDNSYNIVRFLKDDTHMEARRFTPGSSPQTLYKFRAKY